MRYTLSFFLLLLIFSSCWNTTTKKEDEQIAPIEQSHLEADTLAVQLAENSEQQVIDWSTAILLPADGYKTYRDHYVYVNEEEYFDTDPEIISHFDDTISVGLNDRDNVNGLSDSLKLGEKWLCIGFPDEWRRIAEYTIDIRETVSHSANDMIDYVPVTLLSEIASDDNYMPYGIAFRGNYQKSDFEVLDNKDISDDEHSKIISIIRKKVNDPNSIAPRPMASDTLLLDNVYKVDNELFVVKYTTTIRKDSDGDFGNDAIFVIKEGKVVEWIAAMYCSFNLFELRGQKYLCVNYSTYATGVTKLFKLGDKVEEIYSNLFWGD